VSTSFLFAILGGLGIENGIHIFSRYYEERTGGMAREEALGEIYAHTGRSILTSVASVAVTFLLLILNDFRGFSEFGLIAGLGLWVIFIVYFGAMPSLLILFEKIKLLKFRTGAGEPEFNLNVKPAFLKAALAVFALFSLFSFFVTPKVGFEYDSKKTRAEIPKVVEAKKKQRLTATRVNNPAAIVIQSPSEAPALKQAVAEKIEAEKKATGETTLEGSLVYADVAPADLEEKKAVMGEILKLLEDHTIVLVKGEKRADIDRFKKELAEAEPFAESDIPAELKDLFRGKPEVPGEVFYINPKPKLELDDGRIAMKFAEEIGTLKTPNGVYHPSSDGVVYGMVLKTMLNDSKKVLAISLLSVAFFVFVDFRSARKTFIVMTSIVVGVFWLLGICWMAGLKLNFYNMIIVPAVMGMSIDNSIHVFHRYEELGPGSLPKVLGTTGLSALIASLTNASGFFGLLFCLHKGLYSIGLLAVIGVGTCLLSTLVFLPALLQFLENFRGRKAPV
ncbi:MAG TPA: MMPL family transporter, partial [bacterium]|nr:MMPL family transporter [bacterium]